MLGNTGFFKSPKLTVKYNETLIEIKDTLLQKLNFYSKRLKRYKNNKLLEITSQ
jgi:hypothetical protein